VGDDFGDGAAREPSRVGRLERLRLILMPERPAVEGRPESLARSFAGSLRAIHNVKLAPCCNALLVICPEHERTFRNTGWSKARLYKEGVPTAGWRDGQRSWSGLLQSAMRRELAQTPPGRKPGSRSRHADTRGSLETASLSQSNALLSML
jgi:hypothetical protein